MRIKNTIALGLFLVFTSIGLSVAAEPLNTLDAARSAFNRGRADEALHALNETIRQNSANAAAWNLQCRVYLAQSRWDDAIGSCQHAVKLEANSSEYHLWLGRAYGEKASRTNLVAAYQLAKLTRAEFEAAVSLDGNDREALSDLGQYYVDAPRFLGGGYPKAGAIIERLKVLDPARAYELRGTLAEARKDYATAEQNWRAKIAASQSSPQSAAQAWMDLGSFYRRRGNWDQMIAALKSGAAADPNHGPALVDGAGTLIKAGREQDLAAEWLRQYLDGNALSDAAPAFAVHDELGNLLKQQGNASAAEREFAAARALSANYAAIEPVSTGY